MSRLKKLLIFSIIILGSLISVKDAKALSVTYNVSTTPVTVYTGCNATGCGYSGQTTYINVWDSGRNNCMKSISVTVYKDGAYDISDTRTANNYMNWANIGFIFYNTGYYTYDLKVTYTDGGISTGDGGFYIYDTQPSVTSYAVNKNVSVGNSATFSVSASGTNLSYQWYYTTSSTGHSGTLISGATGSSYTVNTSSSNASTLSGRYYYCKISNYGNSAIYAGTSSTSNAKLSITRTINYNANGGSGAPPSQIKIYNNSITLSNTKPTWSGHTFKGWSTSSTATTPSYSAGSSFNNDSYSTLYAVWELDKYTVQYNANGGSGAPSSQIKYKGTAITLSSTKPTRDGYEFLGWSTSRTATSADTSYAPGSKYNTDANLTLYAVWKLKNKYTITYNANGGSGAPESQTKNEGTAITLSNIKPTRDGYEFLGWSTLSTATSANSSYAPGSTYNINSNLILYAVWKAKEYTVNYDANGGEYAPRSQTKNDGVTLTLSQSKPTKEGYTFLGWSTSRFLGIVDYKPGDTYSEDKDIVLYAVWKMIEYNVTYDMNGGTGYISNQTKYYGVDLTLSDIIPTKTGSKFLGWSKSRYSTNVDYYSGDIYRLNEELNLYAVWKINEYEVRYDANGGSYAPDDQIKKYGISIKLSQLTPIREGYEFLGWTTSRASEEIYYFPGDTYSLNSDVTLYAVWRVNEYTIRYDANGGSGEPQNQKKEYGESIRLSSYIPYKTGSKFLGWSTDNTCTTIEYAPGDVYSADEDVTLYAVWENNYKEPSRKKTTNISASSNIKKEYGTKKFNLNVKTNSNGKITYKISHSRVAAIDKKGNVTIKGYGKAIITVKVAETNAYKAKSKKIILCIVPDGVKNFKAESTSRGIVKFTWKGTNVKNAKCQIQASLTPDFKDTMSVPSPSITKGKYIAKGLDSGKTYYFRIRVAVKVSGKTYYSGWVTKKVRIK